MAARRLEEVFGISGSARQYSYVDRGGLDAEVKYLLGTDRHIVIHGDSKQGKTWIRDVALAKDESVMVECLRTSTPADILQQALGLLGARATLRYSEDRTISGEIDFSANGELGNKVLAGFGTQFNAKGGRIRSTKEESAPIGKSPGDLSWVAKTIEASGRRLVIEEFHYLPAEQQKEFSFLLKALLEYNVRVVIVGVWAENHLLSFYNGDLSGRVEDLRLEWTDDELREVLRKGAHALNITFSDAITDAMIEDAFGNVGLLQRLAERVCRSAGILERERLKTNVSATHLIGEAREKLCQQMEGRFLSFGQRITDRRILYRELMPVVLKAGDVELLSGLALDALPGLIENEGGRKRSKSEIRMGMVKIATDQAASEIQPPVLAWDQANNRLFLVDRSFLFFRKHATISWPWEATV